MLWSCKKGHFIFIAEGVFDNSTHMLMANQPTAESYTFWDTIHPTDDTRRLIARAAYQEIASVPRPATMFRFGIGGFALAGARTAATKDAVVSLLAERWP